MPAQPRHRARRTPARYRIVIRGSISPRLLELLEHPTVGGPAVSSTLTCEIVDQVRLQSVLGWLQEEGVEIVSFEPLDP